MGRSVLILVSQKKNKTSLRNQLKIATENDFLQQIRTQIAIAGLFSNGVCHSNLSP
jgi:hypothetical protein